jgi:hypothetical protein
MLLLLRVVSSIVLAFFPRLVRYETKKENLPDFMICVTRVMIRGSSLHEIWSGVICETLLILKHILYLIYKYCICFEAAAIALSVWRLPTSLTVRV